MKFVNFKKALMAGAASATLLSGAGAAHASCSSGFIANALCEAGVIDRGPANALDRLHAAMGRPLDHAANAAAGAAANYVAPGSGTAVTQALEMRDRWRRAGGNFPPGPVFHPGPAFHPGPVFYPRQVFVPRPVFRRVCFRTVMSYPYPHWQVACHLVRTYAR